MPPDPEIDVLDLLPAPRHKTGGEWATMTLNSLALSLGISMEILI